MMEKGIVEGGTEGKQTGLSLSIGVKHLLIMQPIVMIRWKLLIVLMLMSQSIKQELLIQIVKLTRKIWILIHDYSCS